MIDEFFVLFYPMVLLKLLLMDLQDHAIKSNEKQKILFKKKRIFFLFHTSNKIGPVVLTSVNRFRISDGIISC
jgi:hypothetical protein